MKISNSRNRLKELLNESGDSQNEMARKTGLTKSAISNYLNGTREPRQDAISKICDAYKVNPAWIMGLDSPKEQITVNEIEPSIVEENNRIAEYLKAISQLREGYLIDPKETTNIINGVENNEKVLDIQKALEMYKLYENSEPHIKAAVESLLKGPQ